MRIKQLYSSLNVLYLKMFQYGKYIKKELVNDILDRIDEDSDWLQKKYGKEYDLSSISLKEMFSLSMVNSKFNHSSSIAIIKDQLMCDLYELNRVRKDVFKNSYYIERTYKSTF
ncbi:hypothetical protein [Wukongibacter sp. M2B1]|uniref:hypothetical protein n=1 Tax=Wukongibacter sp. M2B1 TaxID=3088895 RepID=UPI003D7B8F9A